MRLSFRWIVPALALVGCVRDPAVSAAGADGDVGVAVEEVSPGSTPSPGSAEGADDAAGGAECVTADGAPYVAATC